MNHVYAVFLEEDGGRRFRGLFSSQENADTFAEALRDLYREEFRCFMQFEKPEISISYKRIVVVETIDLDAALGDIPGLKEITWKMCLDNNAREAKEN